MSQTTPLWLLLLLAVVQVHSSATPGVELIEDFDSFLPLHPRAIVFFSQEGCWECEVFSEVYALVAENNTDIAYFSKLEYTEATKSVFARFGIDAVPFVAAFDSGKIMEHPFEVITSPQVMVLHLSQWVQRLWTPIPEHTLDAEVAHQVAVQCSEGLKEAWNDLRLSELWLEVTCG